MKCIGISCFVLEINETNYIIAIVFFSLLRFIRFLVISCKWTVITSQAILGSSFWIGCYHN